MNNDKIYTVETAANLLSITQETLRKELRKGTIQGTKKLNRWYILHSQILVFIRS